MVKRPKRDLVEVFGYAPDDLSNAARSLWRLSACPFTLKPCSKTNHDKSVTYGTCSVTTPFGDCVICPNRMYQDDYASIKRVAIDAFGADIPVLMYDQYVLQRTKVSKCVVVLGHNSGQEVQLGNRLSMDWVLAKIEDGTLLEYTGIEVQSIDITGNYRDCWHGYRNLVTNTLSVPSSAHGLNWANVHKRLIPQIIRKGRIYSKSQMVNHGIYFVLPEIVYKKFEELIGADIPLLHRQGSDVITVHSYELSPVVDHGTQRTLKSVRSIRFGLDEFANRFISGANLPDGNELDDAVRRVLGVQ